MALPVSASLKPPLQALKGKSMPAIPVTKKATSDSMCTLRVYGGKNVAGPGVLYKSIVINQRSTAAEVIDLTLKRYGSNSLPWEFELRYGKSRQPKRKGFHLFKQKAKPADSYVLSAADCPFIVADWFEDDRRFELFPRKASSNPKGAQAAKAYTTLLRSAKKANKTKKAALIATPPAVAELDGATMNQSSASQQQSIISNMTASMVGNGAALPAAAAGASTTILSVGTVANSSTASSRSGQQHGSMLRQQYVRTPTPQSPIPTMSTSLVLLDMLIKGENWFHGKINRESTVDLLNEAGAFLVRENPNNSGELALSVRTDWGQVMHFNIRQDIPGKFRFDGVAFASVHELISYYMTNNFSVSKEYPAKLVTGVFPKADLDISAHHQIIDDAEMLSRSILSSRYTAADGVAGLASESVLERCNGHARREIAAAKAVLDILPERDPAAPALRKTVESLTAATMAANKAVERAIKMRGGGKREESKKAQPKPVQRGRSRILIVGEGEARPIPPPPRGKASEAAVRSVRSPDIIPARDTGPASTFAGVGQLPTSSILSDDSLGSFMMHMGHELEQSQLPASSPLGGSGGGIASAAGLLTTLSAPGTSSDDARPASLNLSYLQAQSREPTPSTPQGAMIQIAVKMSRASASERWGFAIAEADDDSFRVIDLAESGPAAAVLVLDDIITHINGTALEGHAIDAIVSLMRGVTAIELTLSRFTFGVVARASVSPAKAHKAYVATPARTPSSAAVVESVAVYTPAAPRAQIAMTQISMSDAENSFMNDSMRNGNTSMFATTDFGTPVSAQPVVVVDDASVVAGAVILARLTPDGGEVLEKLPLPITKSWVAAAGAAAAGAADTLSPSPVSTPDESPVTKFTEEDEAGAGAPPPPDFLEDYVPISRSETPGDDEELGSSVEGVGHEAAAAEAETDAVAANDATGSSSPVAARLAGSHVAAPTAKLLKSLADVDARIQSEQILQYSDVAPDVPSEDAPSEHGSMAPPPPTPGSWMNNSMSSDFANHGKSMLASDPYDSSIANSPAASSVMNFSMFSALNKSKLSEEGLDVSMLSDGGMGKLLSARSATPECDIGNKETEILMQAALLDVDHRIKHLKEEKRRSMLIMLEADAEPKKVPPPIAPKPSSNNSNQLPQRVIAEEKVYTLEDANNLSIQSENPINQSVMISEQLRDEAGLQTTGAAQRERPGQYRKALQPVNTKPVHATPLRKTGVQFSVRGSIRRGRTPANGKKGPINSLKGSWRKSKQISSPLQNQGITTPIAEEKLSQGPSPKPELMDFGAKRAIWGTTV